MYYNPTKKTENRLKLKNQLLLVTNVLQGTHSDNIMHLSVQNQPTMRDFSLSPHRGDMEGRGCPNVYLRPRLDQSVKKLKTKLTLNNRLL